MADTVLTIGSIGTRLDLEIRAGDTLGPYTLTFKDKLGAPIDLAGATVSAVTSLIDAGEGSEVAINTAISDAVNGKATITFAAASTAGWDSSLTGANDFAKTKKLYGWLCRCVDAAGQVRSIFYGYIYVASKKLP